MARLIDTPLVDASLMEVAREIGPVLRQESNGSEYQRRLTQGAVDALSSGGLLTMLTSKSMGGQEVNPITYASVVEEISRSDPSSGWSLVNPLLWAFLCSRLPDQGADELLGNDPRAWFTAAIAPPLTAVPVDGGYIVSGRGLFASNCHHPAWFAAVCEVKPGQDRTGTGKLLTLPSPYGSTWPPRTAAFWTLGTSWDSAALAATISKSKMPSCLTTGLFL